MSIRVIGVLFVIFPPYFSGGLIILIMMSLLWIVNLILLKSRIIEIFWGAGLVIIGWVYLFLVPGGHNVRKILFSLWVTIWGLRQSIQVFLRNKGKGEDLQYRKGLNELGSQWRSYLFISSSAAEWWTLLSPDTMTGLILKVSGVALLTKTLPLSKPGH